MALLTKKGAQDGKRASEIQEQRTRFLVSKMPVIRHFLRGRGGQEIRVPSGV